MSKSILVVDTPSKCRECPICTSIQLHAWARREYWCAVMGYSKPVNNDERPKWCPLQLMIGTD